MARAFSENQRWQVRAALKREAQRCMVGLGMRKTSIDELVGRVGISKGSFYAFFESKEMLFFEVITDYHDKTQSLIVEQVGRLGQEPTGGQIAEILFQSYKGLDNPMILSVMASGEMEWLMGRLPQDVVDNHHQRDDGAMGVLLERISFVDQESIPRFSAALRAIFSTVIHKREIGPEFLDDVVRVLLEGICAKYIAR